jgi:hypothetical protein
MTRLEQLRFHSRRRRLATQSQGLCSKLEQIRVFLKGRTNRLSSTTAMSHDT